MKMFNCPQCGTKMVMYPGMTAYCPGCGIICRTEIDPVKKFVSLTRLDDKTLDDLGDPVELDLMMGQAVDADGNPSGEPFIINAADPDPIEEYNRRHPFRMSPEAERDLYRPMAKAFGMSVDEFMDYNKNVLSKIGKED